MNMEFQILDWIQSIRTPLGDVVMPWISALGNAGMIWIVLAAVLLLIPKTRKSGVILALALCVDVLMCNVILKNVFARIRPCDVNTPNNNNAAILMSTKTIANFFPAAFIACYTSFLFLPADTPDIRQ